MNIPYLKIAKYQLVSSTAAIISAISTLAAFADHTNLPPQELKIDAAKTKVKDGFFIGLVERNSYSTNHTSLNDELCLFVWTTNNPTWIAIPAELEYAYQVELLDTNGVAMPKTELGKKVGAKFFEFDTFPSKKSIAVEHMSVKKIGQSAGASFLFNRHPARDLFEVDRPANYTLQVRFQILTFPRTGPNQEIIRMI